MVKLLKCDCYRIGKSKLFYAILAFTGFLAFFLMMVMRQDIRIGISVFGNLTAFKESNDIILIGTKYQKGLGILVAILIGVWIGQEYQWGTWQHKWIISKSRTSIYLSKAIISTILSAAVFLLFELIALLSCGQVTNILTDGYMYTIISGFAVYAALGSVICLLSMLIKNNITSMLVCLCYILFSETVWSFITFIKNISNFSLGLVRMIELGMRHSIYGMSTIISSTVVSGEVAISIVINAVLILFLTTVLGLFIFQRYEL